MKKTLMVASIMLLAASFSYAQSSHRDLDSIRDGRRRSGDSCRPSPAFASSRDLRKLHGDHRAHLLRTNHHCGGTITVEITTDFSTGGTNGGPSVASSAHCRRYADLLTCTRVAPSAGRLASACSSYGGYRAHYCHNRGDLWGRHSVRIRQGTRLRRLGL